ncbi:hypothetical protein GE061_003479 [Apolygus lucorum]|uniref:C2H2-type domain-containing protein n=1 Tax=Apolygus lucorum TaxID=248454 RepID=A0A8S9X4R2_APOLU|nr:hypothetical protein GE061_003479 [Apolygus lucorum]
MVRSAVAALSTSSCGAYNKLCCSEEEKKPSNDNELKRTICFETTDRQTDIESDDSSCSELELDDEISQDSDYEENLTCNVCDRFFCSQGQLSAHQQKKRHFGCSSCDSLFPSLMALEHHKEEFEHWSEGSNGPNSEESDRDPSTHEMERLL